MLIKIKGANLYSKVYFYIQNNPAKSEFGGNESEFGKNYLETFNTIPPSTTNPSQLKVTRSSVQYSFKYFYYMVNTDRNFRLAIYPKDVATITGKSVKSACRLINKIRNELGKETHHILTIEEFCTYMDLKHRDIAIKLNW